MNLLAVCLIASIGQFAQSETGELHLRVVDPSGLGVETMVELVNDAQQFRSTFTTNAQGSVIAKRLAFGTYGVFVAAGGFAPFSGVVEVRSVLPTEYRARLTVAGVQTRVTVSAGETLIDPSQTSTVNHIGAATLQQRLTALPGRTLPDLVNAQPGWLLEANGILHPRGSEYQTQYVIDGLPLTDNRSPAFAPELDADAVERMKILTGGYPAEYGRKLGGVIEVVTAGALQHGLHAALAASAGSFSTASGTGHAGYAGEGFSFTATGAAATTDRYLDAPVEENFSNNGTTSNVALRYERDFSTADRFGAIVRRGSAAFQVPNERVQQEAGQRQDTRIAEIAGQFSYQRILSSRAVMDVRGFARRLNAALWSNSAATPIHVTQQRGFREVYIKAAVAGHHGIHEWKAGGDIVVAALTEQFAYRVTDPSSFDGETAAAFTFDDRASDREQALFVQDHLRWGPWTVNAGLRWDHYGLIVDETALSPRLAVAWARPAANVVLRASYDRVFQTPAFENLLLASSEDLDAISDDVLRLPVRPSRGHFYEAGLTKGFGAARFDLTHFRRHVDNAADDDVLLNTGVSFPIAFHRSEIIGTEAKLEMPHRLRQGYGGQGWRAISASAAYGYMRGVAELPITGGLFLEEDAKDLLEATDSFPISQDQRHTLRVQMSYRVTDRAWLGLAAVYNSGLPVESESDLDDAVEQYGARIVEQVDLENERVRPSWTVDASAGTILKRGDTGVRLQVDVRNLTNRLNVINFAGLFSGTALAPPRSVAIRLHAAF